MKLREREKHTHWQTYRQEGGSKADSETNKQKFSPDFLPKKLGSVGRFIFNR